MLIEARSRGYQRLEQMVSGGAAATLIFSITSAEKLIEQPRTYSAELVSLAWVLLLLSLSISLGAQYCSARAFTHELRVLDRAIAPERANRWQQWNGITGITSTVLFVVGISLIAIAAFTSRTY